MLVRLVMEYCHLFLILLVLVLIMALGGQFMAPLLGGLALVGVGCWWIHRPCHCEGLKTGDDMISPLSYDKSGGATSRTDAGDMPEMAPTKHIPPMGPREGVMYNLGPEPEALRAHLLPDVEYDGAAHSKQMHATMADPTDYMLADQTNRSVSRASQRVMGAHRSTKLSQRFFRMFMDDAIRDTPWFD